MRRREERGGEERLRDASLASRSARGLTRARCHADATGKRAVGERCVDPWGASPECTRTLNVAVIGAERSSAMGCEP